MTISRITECHFCFSAKGILSGDQSSVLTFTLRGSQTAPGKTVKQKKIGFSYIAQSTIFSSLDPFQSSLQPGSDLLDLVSLSLPLLPKFLLSCLYLSTPLKCYLGYSPSPSSKFWLQFFELYQFRAHCLTLFQKETLPSC